MDENDCKHLSDLTIQLVLVCVIKEQTRAIGHGGLSVTHCREHALFNNIPSSGQLKARPYILYTIHFLNKANSLTTKIPEQ